MADSYSNNKPKISPTPTRELHRPISTTTKSYTRFICKSLFFAIFVIALPLFPSQAPDFINQTILTKFWELVHLLFIGIAVSYGLFSRRNVEMDTETHSHFDDSQSYESKFFHVSSIFDDGCENPYAFCEKNVFQTWNSQYYKGESMVAVSNGNYVLNEHNNKPGFENPPGYNEQNVIQAWNSQYFQGESMVVVANGNYVIDECGYKPLGLPVRSLKSRVKTRGWGSSEFSNGSESSSSSKGSSSKSSDNSDNRKFGDLGPKNLEEKFNETVAKPSPIPWRSRSVRMEMRENVGTASRPAHFRPLSVDETQFESLKSRSFRSTGSFSSQSSSMSHSPSRLSPSHTVSSELPNSKMEELEREKSFRQSYPPASTSPAPMNGKAPLDTLHSRRYSMFEKDVPRSFEDDLKDLSGSKRVDSLGTKGLESGFFKLEAKPAPLVKSPSRGKSVRTIRASGSTGQVMKVGEMSGNHVDDKFGKTCCNEVEAAYLGKRELKSGGIDNLSNGTDRQNLDNNCPMFPTMSEYLRREKQEYSENSVVESKENSESEADNFHVSSDEEVVSDMVSEAGHESSEVDKKADEFIAKFREQIRLQKVASIDRSRGLNIRGNYFR